MNGTTEPPTPNLNNIQGVGLAGFRKDYQELLFIRFGDPASGRRLLERLQPGVASHQEVAAFNALFSEIRQRRDREHVIEATWTALLISAHGYGKLGVDLGGLPAGEGATAFSEGMAQRSKQIGDTRQPDAPTQWKEAFRPGAGVDALVIVAADDEDDLDQNLAKLNELIPALGCEVVVQERGATLKGDLVGHEHFGFKDGISQPSIAGLEPAPVDNEPPAVALGEFVIGYPDQTGQVAATGELWTDGSFVVFRRLQQNVFAFRQQAQAPVPDAAPALSSEQLEAKMVGRWPSGAPTEIYPDSDPGASGVTNAFAYQGEDAEGLKTPRFAHIRKANPRDEALPVSEPVERRRMIRRGIPFGQPLPPEATEDDGHERGLHFISIVADVAGQFEFIQRQWMNDPNFPNGGEPSEPNGPYPPPVDGPPDGPDPVVGQHDPGVEDSLHQAEGTVHPFPLGPEVVNVTAGEYFFAPSIAAIGLLAGGATKSPGVDAGAPSPPPAKT